MNVPRPNLVAKRMVWMAYQASETVGLGYLQARDDITEAHMSVGLLGHDDFDLFCDLRLGDECNIHADYLFGRMMKLYFSYTHGRILLPDRKLEPEYQSWCVVYPTLLDLMDSAIKSLESKP